MGDSHVPMTDTEITTLRDAGALVCQCSWTVPQRIGLFDTWQCPRCYKALPRHTQQSGLRP
jgi:hypothetical protein